MVNNYQPQGGLCQQTQQAHKHTVKMEIQREGAKDITKIWEKIMMTFAFIEEEIVDTFKKESTL